MKRIAVFLASLGLLMAGAAAASAISAPTLSADDKVLSWSAVNGADGYNVYLDDNYLTTVNGTSFTTSEAGDYYVTSFDKDTNPTSYSSASNPVNVPGDGGDPGDNGPGTPGPTGEGCTDLASSNLRVSFPNNGCHYQVQDDRDGATVCESWSPSSRVCNVQLKANHTYRVNVWIPDWSDSRQHKFTTQTTDDPGTDPGEEYGGPKFKDEFNGSSLSSNWDTPAWPGDYRPAKFTRSQCEVKDGRLKLKAQLVNGQVQSCFAIFNRLVGPGDGQVRIEVQADVDRIQAEGGWFAAWLQTLSGNGNPYDNNPATGSEIDIMEYVPYRGPYRYANGATRDYRNSYHVATHIVDGTGGFSPGGNGFVDMNPLGFNLRSGDNKFSLEWNASCQVFAVNGKTVFTNRQGVSKAKVHRPILSIEMDNANSSAGGQVYNQWGFASGNFADNLRNSPAEATVNYIRIYEKGTTDNLCN